MTAPDHRAELIADRRAATLEVLHSILASTTTYDGSRENAIVCMAIRYGNAVALQGDTAFDFPMTSRARERRFTALQRLVYGGAPAGQGNAIQRGQR